MDSITVIVSIVSILISIAAVVVSYYSFARTFKTGIRPVLIFTFRSDSVWQVENVGNGPAVSLTIGDMDWQGEWRIIANCYPMAAGAIKTLPWLKYGKEMAAVYTDINGAVFTTRCHKQNSVLSRRNEFPQWRASQNEMLLILACDKDNTSTLTEAQLLGMTESDLEIKQNELFARHGYRFSHTDLSDYFSGMAWYHPDTDDIALVRSRFSLADNYELHLIRHVKNKKTAKVQA